MPINVGVSELPGRTFGKMQVMTNVQAGLNLRAGLYELERDYGEVATVNEADRSRPDQLFMRAEYLAGRGPLAAYCSLDPRPDGTWTSTHDSGNHGDAADIGGPNGTVLSVRAHNLLDGNHPDGVLGRKYGIFNTGASFWTPEWWHFNIYPSRAQKLATLADSMPAKPTPRPHHRKDSDDMQVAWNDTKDRALIVSGGRFTVIDKSTPERSGIGWKQQITLCERFAAVDPSTSYPGSGDFNTAQLNVVRAIISSMQEQV